VRNDGLLPASASTRYSKRDAFSILPWNEGDRHPELTLKRNTNEYERDFENVFEHISAPSINLRDFSLDSSHHYASFLKKERWILH